MLHFGTLWHERDISHSSVERVIIPDSTITLNYMLYLMIGLVKRLIIYPENMNANLNLTRGLVFSQTVLLHLVDKGLSREQAYKLVQTAAMDVWKDKDKNLRDELIKSEEIKKYISIDEINDMFDNKKMLKNVDLIFARTVEK